MNDIEKAIYDLEDLKDCESLSSNYFKEIHGKNLEVAISCMEKQLTNSWIPCKNRQPANEESVKYKSDFIIQDKRYKLPYVATWNKGKKLWQDEEGKQIDTVVAWQPLPEPYKAD